MSFRRNATATTRRLTQVAGGAAGLLVLTGCSGGATRTSAASPSPSIDAPATTPPPAASSPTITTPPASAGATKLPTTAATTRATGSGCSTPALSITIAQGGGGAGSTFATLSFTNRGASSCTLTGYPGVAYLGGSDRHQVGAPAVRSTGGAPVTVRLASGARATAALRQGNPHIYPASDCHPVPVNGLRIYPPNQTSSIDVALPAGTDACAARQLPGGPQLGVGPVQHP